MSVDLYAYYPDVCDGDVCVGDCTYCPKKDDAEAARDYFEPDDSQLEMGFDQYAGCYTDDC